jgi:integral membrane protein
MADVTQSNQSPSATGEPKGRSAAVLQQKRAPETVRKSLTFFKVMAIVVGCGLLLLTLQVILKYGFDNHALDFWPQPHGFIFIIYVVATANLGFKVGWSLGKMVLVMLAGCVPFLSFWVEQRMSREVEGLLAGQPAAGSLSA